MAHWSLNAMAETGLFMRDWWLNYCCNIQVQLQIEVDRWYGTSKPKFSVIYFLCFHTPVWKPVSCRGNICPFAFSRHFSTCFGIPIWNLIYAFSRWHDMSSLSLVTIGSLWTSLQVLRVRCVRKMNTYSVAGYYIYCSLKALKNKIHSLT